jgi:hypothetical protein
MKSIIKSFVLIVFTITTSTILKAQTENTNERLITQLKNGTAPGLVFSTERPAPAPAADKKLNEKESLIAQIRKGKAAGMQFKPVTAGSAPVVARAATVAAPKQPLPSEQPAAKAEQAKPAAKVEPKQE